MKQRETTTRKRRTKKKANSVIYIEHSIGNIWQVVINGLYRYNQGPALSEVPQP